MTRKYGFRESQRLRRRRDFDRVFLGRCSAGDGGMVVYARGNGLPHSRLGLSVGRRVGGAVRRHRVKRLIREAFRLSQYDLPMGFDIICVIRPGIEVQGLADCRARFSELVHAAAGKCARRSATRPPGVAPNDPEKG
jgi:ribonuclease P protein component